MRINVKLTTMKLRHFFLVGPMGSGKSTIGKQLANRLDRPFIDIDCEIESAAGADIQWIFDMEGEEGFRIRESKILKHCINTSEAAVIATGGGIILNKDNRLLLSCAGQVIYLCTTKQQLYERLKRDKKRPLLQVEDRRKVVDELFDQRDPLYREISDIVFTSSSLQVQRTVSELIRQLKDT